MFPMTIMKSVVNAINISHTTGSGISFAGQKLVLVKVPFVPNDSMAVGDLPQPTSAGYAGVSSGPFVNQLDSDGYNANPAAIATFTVTADGGSDQVYGVALLNGGATVVFAAGLLPYPARFNRNGDAISIGLVFGIGVDNKLRLSFTVGTIP